MEIVIFILSVILFIFVLAVEYKKRFNITRIRGSIIEALNYFCIFLSLIVSYIIMSNLKEIGQFITLSLVSLTSLVNDYIYFPLIFAMIIFFLIAFAVYIVLRVILVCLVRFVIGPSLNKIHHSQERRTEKSKQRLGMLLNIPRALFYACLFFVILNVVVYVA